MICSKRLRIKLSGRKSSKNSKVSLTAKNSVKTRVETRLGRVLSCQSTLIDTTDQSNLLLSSTKRNSLRNQLSKTVALQGNGPSTKPTAGATKRIIAMKGRLLKGRDLMKTRVSCLWETLRDLTI